MRVHVIRLPVYAWVSCSSHRGMYGEACVHYGCLSVDTLVPYLFRVQNLSLRRLVCEGTICTWYHKKVREHIAVKMLHNSSLNTTVVAFKVLPLGSYAPMQAPSTPFKKILELVLWNGLQRCHCITPDVINVIKIPSFQYFLYLREQKKKSLGTRSGE